MSTRDRRKFNVDYTTDEYIRKINYHSQFLSIRFQTLKLKGIPFTLCPGIIQMKCVLCKVDIVVEVDRNHLFDGVETGKLRNSLVRMHKHLHPEGITQENSTIRIIKEPSVHEMRGDRIINGKPKAAGKRRPRMVKTNAAVYLEPSKNDIAACKYCKKELFELRDPATNSSLRIRYRERTRLEKSRLQLILYHCMGECEEFAKKYIYTPESNINNNKVYYDALAIILEFKKKMIEKDEIEKKNNLMPTIHTPAYDVEPGEIYKIWIARCKICGVERSFENRDYASVAMHKQILIEHLRAKSKHLTGNITDYVTYAKSEIKEYTGIVEGGHNPHIFDDICMEKSKWHCIICGIEYGNFATNTPPPEEIIYQHVEQCIQTVIAKVRRDGIIAVHRKSYIGGEETGRILKTDVPPVALRRRANRIYFDGYDDGSDEYEDADSSSENLDD